MTDTTLFLLSTLEVGGTELKFIRLANSLASQRYPVHLAWLSPPIDARPEISPLVHDSHLKRRGKFSTHALWRLYKLIKKAKVNTIVCGNLYPLLYAVPAKLFFKKRVKLIVSINLSNIKGHKIARVMWLYRQLLKHADQIIFGAEIQQREWTIEHDIAKDLSIVIYNGVDTRQFRPPTRSERISARRRYGFDKRTTIAVCVAQLLPEKGHKHLFKALTSPRLGTVKLLLVGDGPLRESLQKLAKDLGISERIIFSGQHQSVKYVLRAADVFVLPSTSIETFSNAALEALASAIPVIMTDIGGAGEIIHHLNNGLLVKPGSATELEDAILIMKENPALAKHIGRQGFHHVLEKHPFERMESHWKNAIWPNSAG